MTALLSLHRELRKSKLKQGGIIPSGLANIINSENLIRLGKFLLPIFSSFAITAGLRKLAKKDPLKLTDKDIQKIIDTLPKATVDQIKSMKKVQPLINKKSKDILRNVIQGSGIINL